MILEDSSVPGSSELSSDENQHTDEFQKLIFSGGSVIKA